MALTDLKIKKAKPQERPFKMYDSLGFCVLVNHNGSKLWRQKYHGPLRKSTGSVAA
ncbi:integrase arm-type DNA-binding domain-containing protein [Cribrihabitans sp. XS_ASV171]